MNKHVEEFIDYFLNEKSTNYAIMIKGKWGCGKTYFIKRIIRERKWNSEEGIINIKPIYVSLNGLDKIESINEAIRKELHPFLHSKGVRLTKNIIKGLIKSTAKIDLDFNDDNEFDSNITFNIEPLKIFELGKEEVKGKRLIVFDDVERCKVDIETLYGYINTFVEHLDCKVILVSDEDRIEQKFENNDNNLTYAQFKEKLIGHTFSIKSDPITAIEVFLRDYEDDEFSEYNKDVIIDIFNKSDIHNLRILQQAISDYYRFKEFLNPYIVDKKNTNKFYKNLICYFFIVYLEYKNGNSEIVEFQDFIPDEEEKKKKCDLYRDKYRTVFDKYKIIHSEYILPLDKIKIYIDNGFISSEDLIDESNYSPFFNLNISKDWEKLWYWASLENMEFKELEKKVWEEFKNKELNDIYQVFHVAGIYLNLINYSIIDKKEELIIKIAKSNILKILSEDLKKYVKYTDFDYTASYSKGYQCRDSERFLELIDYFKLKLKELKEEYLKNEINNLFYSINIKDISSIIKKLIELEEFGFYYKYQHFLNYIDGKKMVKKIIKTNSENINEFRYFLVDRYYKDRYMNTLDKKDYNNVEIDFLTSFNDVLRVSIPKRNIIKKHNIIQLVNAIDKIINSIKRSYNIEEVST